MKLFSGLKADMYLDMTVIYKKYSMSDDNAVKNAILKLKEKWKNELNKLKIADIEKDFK